jgi:hypothetical protein
VSPRPAGDCGSDALSRERVNLLIQECANSATSKCVNLLIQECVNLLTRRTLTQECVNLLTRFPPLQGEERQQVASLLEYVALVLGYAASLLEDTALILKYVVLLLERSAGSVTYRAFDADRFIT